MCEWKQTRIWLHLYQANLFLFHSVYLKWTDRKMCICFCRAQIQIYCIKWHSLEFYFESLSLSLILSVCACATLQMKIVRVFEFWCEMSIWPIRCYVTITNFKSKCGECSTRWWRFHPFYASSFKLIRSCSRPMCAFVWLRDPNP